MVKRKISSLILKQLYSLVALDIWFKLGIIKVNIYVIRI